MAAKKKQEPTAEQRVAAELVRQAREAALQEEMTEHLGYEKHEPAGAGIGFREVGEDCRMYEVAVRGSTDDPDASTLVDPLLCACVHGAAHNGRA